MTAAEDRRTVLAWLRAHPRSSAATVARYMGISDRHVFWLLEMAERAGLVVRERRRGGGPWLWQVPGEAEAVVAVLLGQGAR